MIIDAHIHVGVWDHPDFLGRSCTLTDVVGVLEAAGISGAGIMPTDQCDNAGLLAERKAVTYDGDLWQFSWVRPAGTKAGDADLAWTERHAAELTGIKIHPSLSRLRVTDPAFAPALDIAERDDLVVLIHCGRWQEIASYKFAVELAQTRPKARFVLAHAGGDTPPLSTAAARLVADTRVDNVWFEFSGVREYWVIERNVALLGPERYMMGSDYSLAHPNMYIGAIAGMDLPEPAKRKILGENARALYGATR